jgi:hypothetical protein
VDILLPRLADLDSVTAGHGVCEGTSFSLDCLLGALANGAQGTVTIVMTDPGANWAASVVLRQAFAEDALAVFARTGIIFSEADIDVEIVPAHGWNHGEFSSPAVSRPLGRRRNARGN